ncbi:MAG: hypothetical protein R6V01_00255 [Thermoplasmatota archaeon]
MIDMSGEQFFLEVFHNRENGSRTVRKEKGWDLTNVLRRFDIPLDGVIVLSGDTPLPLDHPVEDLESITIINVASGG